MNGTMSLYKMELRKNRSFFITVLALQVLFIAARLTVQIMQILNSNSLDPYNVLPISELLLNMTLIAFPLMLLYSWHREERDRTSYQVLSFPVKPDVILRNKIAAFLSIGAVWIAFSTLALSVFWWMRASHNLHVPFDYSTVPMAYLRYFCDLFALLGFMCLVISILQVIKQRRLLAGTGIILAGVTLYLFLNHHYVSFLRNVYGKIIWVAPTYVDPHGRVIKEYELIDGHGEIVSLIMTAHNFLPLLIGIACMYTGFYLFDRYSEV